MCVGFDDEVGRWLVFGVVWLVNDNFWCEWLSEVEVCVVLVIV